jgi:hypothetical protein
MPARQEGKTNSPSQSTEKEPSKKERSNLSKENFN